MTADERCDELIGYAERLIQYLRADDHGLTLSTCRRINEELAEITMVVCQRALDAGMTKKKMADHLDVPAATFRGMQKTNTSDGPKSLSALLSLDQ